MPDVSGKSLISETTEKVLRRAVVISSAAILTKLYHVPLNDLKVLGIELPANLFDTVLVVLVLFHMYSLTINWMGDLAAFRLWFSDNSILSDFGTTMKLNRGFIRGGVPLLIRLYEIEQRLDPSADFETLPKEVREKFRDFKTNVELFATRLEHAGSRFSTLSWFGRYYVWVQSFAFPISLCMWALYLVVRYGSFAFPSQI